MPRGPQRRSPDTHKQPQQASNTRPAQRHDRTGSRSRISTLALLLVALLGLTACGTRSAAGPAEGTLRVVGPFEIHSIDPTSDGEIFTRLEVAETLVTSDLKGELEPGLATRWSSSERGKVWRFDMVKDATFHDGSPLTAEAAVAALRETAKQEASPLAEVPIAQIKAQGTAVIFELSHPYLTLPAVLTHYSAAILSPSSYNPDGRVIKVVGTGPYEVDEVELPAKVKTKRFEDYRGDRPAIDRVDYQTVSRPEQRALLATSGQADVVFGLEPPGRERVDSTDGVHMESSLQPRTLLLKVNAGHPILGDVRVRQALSLSMDRGAISHAVLRERELAATQLLPPSLKAWQADVEPLKYDKAQALALFARAGWKPGADGKLMKAGKPLKLNLVTYPDRPELPALATAIQASLAEVGVDLNVEVSNSSEIPATHADGSLELALVAKFFALVSDPLIDVANVFAPGGSDWGAMGWSDPAVNRAVKALLNTPADQQAQASRHRATIVRVAQEQLPLIPVAWYRMNAAVNDRVSGFVIDPLEASWHVADLKLAP